MKTTIRFAITRRTKRGAGLLLVLAFLAGCSRGEDPGSRAPSTPAPTTGSVHPAESSFAGKIGSSLRDSKPAYEEPVKPNAGSPNVVIVLADDLGFADIAPYGSEIDTPSLQALADEGLRYNHFTVAGVCSPTRAALLTGLNHHSAGVGWLSEWDMGFPSYHGEIRSDVPTLPEILNDHGYATMMVGKWHLTLSAHRSRLGPFDSWPTSRGFERYWGFLDGEASQWKPHTLVSGTEMIPPPDDESFYFPDAMTDQAIAMLRDLRALSPDKPFFLYYATGAPHAPHHTKASDRAKYHGRYDAGYDAIREQRLARQKELGVVPADTRLTDRNPGVHAWGALTDDQRKMYARLQENYAAFVDNLDQNVGRLRDYLRETGELENTIFVFLSDNGASREVGVEGDANVLAFFHHRPSSTEENLSYYDRIGEVDTHPHYPHGWVQASNTPFAHAKRTSWAGGVRAPLIVSWPARIRDTGSVRTQLHHVNDLAPTLLELLGIAPPTERNGRAARPMEGTSLAYTFDDAHAASRKQSQYYEVEAQRAYTDGRWRIVSFREENEPYDVRDWMLFDLASDFSETTDVAARHPEKVKELDARWWEDARRYGVLPLIDVPLLERAFRTRRDPNEDRKQWRLVPETSPILVGNAPGLAGKSYRITADVRRDDESQQGVLVAHGDTHSGYSLVVKEDRLWFEMNSGHTRYRVTSDRTIPTGDVRLGVRFEKVSTGLALASSALRGRGIDPLATLRGTATLFIGDEPAGSVEIDHPVTAIWEGLEIGRDGLTPVSKEYASPFPFEGTVREVVYDFD